MLGKSGSRRYRAEWSIGQVPSRLTGPLQRYLSGSTTTVVQVLLVATSGENDFFCLKGRVLQHS